MDDEQSPLDLEIELLQSSLLGNETLTTSSTSSGGDPQTIDITSSDSKLALHVTIGQDYPESSAILVEVKGPDINRDEAEDWKVWVDERMSEWDETDDYPLYQLLTTHILPVLAPSSPSVKAASPPPTSGNIDPLSDTPHHALLTSHHLLSSTKRKDLISLSSSLSLVGFAKRGHPGIMYATGTRDDLTEWIREVKSWNWLALRVRMSAEPIPGADELESGKGGESGARGGKGRGEWMELEKINEALDWLKVRGREHLLLDLGIGGATTKS